MFATHEQHRREQRLIALAALATIGLAVLGLIYALITRPGPFPTPFVARSTTTATAPTTVTVTPLAHSLGG